MFFAKSIPDGIDLPALRDGFFALCQDRPELAAVLVFALLIASVYWLISNFFGFFQVLLQWTGSRWRFAGLVLGCILALLLSWEIVASINRELAPKPVFDLKTRTFAGRQIFLKWTYKNDKIDERSVTYEIQSAENKLFSAGKRSEEGAETKTKRVDRAVNGTRFWRVRAVNRRNHEALSDWSAPVEIEQYESALKRVIATGSLAVSTSIAIDHGVFRFFKAGDELSGYDIKLIEAIARRLPAKLGIDRRLTVNFSHVSWDELLRAPQLGRADVIISTITKTADREENRQLKFSDTYYCTTQSLIYRANQPVNQPAGELLPGHKVAVQSGSTSEKLVEAFPRTKPAIELKRFLDPEALIEALLDGGIDFAVIDTPFAESQKLRKGAYLLDYREFNSNDFPAQVSPRRHVEEYAMAVSVREPKLLNAINAVLADLKREDKLKLIYQDAIGEFKAVKGIAADVPYGTAPDNQQLEECGVRKPPDVVPPRSDEKPGNG